ncbi:uncharacterized protein LOC120621528 [Pteropus medius]|uniref:uncharacterized protein LOC120621528 n=1 Tax=Pteropus vampyrus TaxID=132908 RepID=UPI00196B6D58|nr:uncharacterized protein LOC120621528 [Pteropus giganteus]
MLLILPPLLLGEACGGEVLKGESTTLRIGSRRYVIVFATLSFGPCQCQRQSRQHLLRFLWGSAAISLGGILREAARGVTDPNGLPTADLTRIQAVFPTQRPQWDPNTDQEIAQKVFNNRDDVEKIMFVGKGLMPGRGRRRGRGGRSGFVGPPGPGSKQGCQGSNGPREPRITLQVGGQPVNFLVDTGATYSVLNQPVGPVSKEKTTILGATGQGRAYPWTQARITDLGKGTITHSFLVMPECPYPLLGRDLLQKLQATITFGSDANTLTLGDGPSYILYTVPLAEEYILTDQRPAKTFSALLEKWKKEIPVVWAENNPPGLAAHQPPIVVTLNSNAMPVRVKQYPINQKAREGIAIHIRRLQEAGILVPCHSPWNTPLLPVQKPGTEDYRPVQDLREVNKRVETIHPTVPNPYTLLSQLPPSHQVYTVLDLKDAFFSLPLATVSQPIFAFEWEDPKTGQQGQLTWTRLPQGFKNSPTLFDEALSRDIAEFRQCHPDVVLLQYVDDLLLATKTTEACTKATEDLLNELGNKGYRVSAKKAQLCTPAAIYLGYKLNKGERQLSESRIEAILRIPPPKTKRLVREFLGAVGYCRLWILGFAEIAKPLYDCTAGKGEDIKWTIEQQQAFETLKKALISAPALALPNLEKPFQLFVEETRGVAKGVLTQMLGPWKRPVAYLSKRLDCVAAGWPNCLRAVAATAVLVKEAHKLTLGQPVTVIGPHFVERLLKGPPERWISNARITQYQVLLLNPPQVRFAKPTILNPATLLPDDDPQEPVHDCSDLLESITGVRPDLRDDTVVWAQALGQGTSAQKAELMALTEALKWARGKTVNIYTDSRYAFATAHVHGALYKERGLLTSGGKEIKNKEQILALLEAIWLPKKVAIIHCPGHQKGKGAVEKGNRLADKTAKEVARKPVGTNVIIGPLLVPPLVQAPNYSPQDIELGKQLHGKFENGWLWIPDGRPLLPAALGSHLISQMHNATHLGGTKLIELLKRDYYIPGLTSKARDVSARCPICAQVNSCSAATGGSGVRQKGQAPGEHWEIDFTEVAPGTFGFKYLLVFIDTYSGWTEAFPTRKETAQVVAKKLLTEIVPRFGLPLSLGSDNGPAFIAQTSQMLAKVLGINWKLHCIYRPQSSGQVERMNRTLKETLTKFKLETGENWVSLLPFALLWARCTPYIMGISPYEIMFGRPPPLLPKIGIEKVTISNNTSLLKSLQALQQTQNQVKGLIKATRPTPGTSQPHPHHPGDWVWIKKIQPASLEPRWDGPFPVILTTPTAVKVAGKRHWIHHTRLKAAQPPPEKEKWKATPTEDPLKIRLSRE